MKPIDWFRPKAHALNSKFAPHYLLDSGAFVTKRGALGVAYRLQGIDFDCLTDEELETSTKRLHAVLRTLDPAFRIYQYVVKEHGAALPYHRAGALFTVRLFWVFLYEPPITKRGLRSISAIALRSADIAEQERYLQTCLNAFETALRDSLGLSCLSVADTFQFLRTLAGLGASDDRAQPLQYRDHLDYWIGVHPVQVYRQYLTIGKPVLALSLTELPRLTCPHLFRDLLRLPCAFVLCSEFKRIRTSIAAKKLRDRQDHFEFTKTHRNTKSSVVSIQAKAKGGNTGNGQPALLDGTAAKRVANLDDVLIRINDSGEFFGQYSLTLLLHGTDTATLQTAAAEAVHIAGNSEAAFTIETHNALNAYLATIPGGSEYNLRSQWLPSANYADLALVYGPARGEEINRHLDREALLILETTYQTPYFFNLHENDLLGALLFGVMGSGKSFFANYLIDSSQKYDPFTFILDVGGSYKYLTRKYGGSYLALGERDQRFTINPFALEKNVKNQEFLSSFVHVLLGTAGYTASPGDCRAIDHAVKSADRLSNLALPAHLRDQLYNWIEDGRYGYLFDNAVDTLDINSFQAFDLQGVSEKVLEPLFFYLFNRISQVVYSPRNIGRPKQLFSDEAWKFLNTPAARNYFIEAGKTWRKHNGGIVLITQSALDLERAGLLDCINEICPTKILLANPGANRAFYRRVFDLNDREVELFSQLQSKRQILVKTPQKSAVLNVHVDELASWQYRNDPRSNAMRDAAIEQFGYEEGLQHLAKGA